MSDEKSRPSVGETLRGGLARAKQEGAGSVRSSHLDAEQLDRLARATLAHLRSRPGKPADSEGWQRVSPRVAGVMPWWADEGNLTEAECRRLRTLRQEVYDLLEERQLIRKGPGQGSSVQVSLVDPDEVVGDESGESAAQPETVEEQLGAWVLKLSPYVYDSSLVFSAPDRMVRRWSVEEGDRAARMRHGQPAYLWLGPGDPLREPGIWGVGWVMGAAITGTPDAGWIDVEAASRASLFAVVEITLLEAPVSQSVFLQDSRLSGAEVIRKPLGGNPSLLTPVEAAALAQYVGVSPALPEHTEAT